MLALLPALVFAGATSDDAALLARIEAWRPVAEALVIDGHASDWDALFTMRGAGDIEGVSVAPTSDYLAVLVRVGEDADPLRPVLVSVDMGGGHPIDAIFKVRGSTVFVNWHDDKRYQPMKQAVAARRGQIMELRVAWAQLIADAPAGHPIRQPKGWVRVRAQLAKVDGGARSTPLAVASYRLTFPPPPLDEPVTLPEAQRVNAGLPLTGTWFVTQGAYTPGTHEGTWAYDMVIRDRTHRARLGKELDAALSWGQPVVSPGRGRVRLAIDEHPDRPIGGGGSPDDPANKVIIDLDGRTRMRVGHLQQGSLEVSVDERVQPGQLLGRVGNSGVSSGPHAHLVHTHMDGKPAPVRWQEVTVGLNPVADDPWARRPEAGWEPRGGWFVTPDPRPEPEPPTPQPLAIPAGVD